MEPANGAAGILSIAGGGSRGVMPGAYLEYIQTEFKVNPQDLFQFKAGTSVGSIIAVGLSRRGIQDVSQINQCLLNALPQVFKKPSLLSTILHCDFAFKNKYGGAPLQTALDQQFGNTLFSDTANPVLVMTTRTNPYVDYRFISDVPNPYPNLTMTQVLRASTAAPTYLPGFFITNNQGTKDEFTDGGTSGANDPTEVAINYFSRRIPLKQKIAVLSLGTGQCTLAVSNCSARWGWLSWLAKDNEALITGLFDTMISNTNHIVADWGAGPSLGGRKVLQLNPIIPLKDDALDSSSPEILNALIDIAKVDAEANKDQLGEIVRTLRP